MDALILCGIVSLCGEGEKTERRKKNCFQSTTSAFFSHLWPKGYSPHPLPPPHRPHLHRQALQAEHCIWPLQKQFGKREDPVGVKMTVWLEAWSGETVTPTLSECVCVCVCVSPCWDWGLTTVLTWGLRCEWSGSGGSESPHWASYILQRGHHH